MEQETKRVYADAPPVALITGASRGLGRGIAISLAKEGYSIAIGYRNRLEEAEMTASQCRAGAIDDRQCFHPVNGDISVREDRTEIIKKTLTKLKGIDVLVNNAGIAPSLRSDILETSEESFANVMSTNLYGPYFLTQAVARNWLSNPLNSKNRRTVIFVTSISASYASISRGEYCVSKAGLTMARELFAIRLAADNINVYEIRPGLMQTDMTSSVKEKYDNLITQGLVPQKRWGTAKDVGLAVAALVGDNFKFSQGTVVNVDGGFSLRRL